MSDDWPTYNLALLAVGAFCLAWLGGTLMAGGPAEHKGDDEVTRR